jgi:hypothetical protein
MACIPMLSFNFSLSDLKRAEYFAIETGGKFVLLIYFLAVQA